MKTQFEAIQPDADRSFRLLHNPRLSELFYWHFHPEFELVYIEGCDGPRHVGSHLSRYTGSDLVFIGSNIPHLNFDYGVKTDYQKVVLQLHPDFQQKMLRDVPELSALDALFERARYGIAFGEATRAEIGQRMLRFPTLPAFDQLLEVLRLFRILAERADYTLLHDQPVINPYSRKEQERLGRVYRFIAENYQRPIGLAEVAAICNLSRSPFCRYFKRATGQTFSHFLNHYRISQAKRLLLLGHPVSAACYECGFESLSYFNRTFKSITGENPSAFKRQHRQP